jgi:Sec-independent protein secretion pathway component TatC
MLWLILYAVGFFAMFRASVRFAQKDSEYDWDMDDNHDVVLLTVVSFAVSIVWPISLIAGITMGIVKKAYQRGEKAL